MTQESKSSTHPLTVLCLIFWALFRLMYNCVSIIMHALPPLLTSVKGGLPQLTQQPKVAEASLRPEVRHVMRELIETERLYVTELQAVVEGYIKQLCDPEMRTYVPELLVDKANTLFGNLEDLYEFHGNIFLKDLEECINTPALVGKCFVERKEDFYAKYSLYCQNKPHSESLRRQCGDSNPFFKRCQNRLGHKLPLGAYLLKPVQRITKYQLLLKEMLKYTDNEVGHAEIEEALDTMLEVLRYLNDVMHQAAITGFLGSLKELGRLLTQGPVNMWRENKKDRIKDLRFKPMMRHLFLYERAILFCKKRDDTRGAEKISYSYKFQKEISKIGLTENFRGDKKKFEIWTNAREEVYIIQAPTIEMKEMLVKHIKCLLLSQFDAIRGEARMHYIQKQTIAESAAAVSNPSLNLLEVKEPLLTAHHNKLLKAQSCGQLQRPLNLLGYESPTTPSYLNEDESDEEWSTDDYSTNSNSDEHSNRSSMGEMPVYISLADYMAVDTSEITICEGEMLEVLNMGQDGWWFVRSAATSKTGWAPGSYLEPVDKRSSRASIGSSINIDFSGDDVIKVSTSGAL